MDVLVCIYCRTRTFSTQNTG